MPYPDSDYERSWKMQTKGVMLYPATLERLYAAAPELLDRLKSMVSGAECECDTADEDHPMCDICWSRQVIAKAEGRGE